jgi:flagellar biosynthesis protein FlhB
MQEQEQNRTEPASQFKLSEAKKRGQVAKSVDFNTLVMTAALLAAMAIWGASYWTQVGELCAQLFSSAGSLELLLDTAPAIFTDLAGRTLLIVAPLFALGIVAAMLANLVQTGPILSAEPLKPKFERINPVAGFKRVYNKRILFELFKSLLKLGFFGAIVYLFMVPALPAVLELSAYDPVSIAAWVGDHALALLFRLGLGLLVVGVLDLAYSKWQYRRQQMMSRRELKEESKHREGDPLIRSKIRDLQRENLKQAKSLGKLPDADVLITNPTHFAVALRYDRSSMNAPVVLAKGSDHWAQELKAAARRHGVPILERKTLARALFRRGTPDLEVPVELFVDVARVYGEVNALRRARYQVSA